VRFDMAHNRKTRVEKSNTNARSQVPAQPIDLQLIEDGTCVHTTVMIRNIPNKFTQETFLCVINADFEKQYDFFYLPMDWKNKCNLGYAFINMIEPSGVARLYLKYDGQTWPEFNSTKVCHISYGHIQGKKTLIERFQHSQVMQQDPRCQPLLFHSEGPLQGQIQEWPVVHNTENDDSATGETAPDVKQPQPPVAIPTDADDDQ